MKVDLHIHSIYSDSSRSPEEVCLTAHERKLKILSICDHYSIDAYTRFISACNEYNIIPIVGVELDANWRGYNFHVLAYNFDLKNSMMNTFIKEQKEKSNTECENIIRGMSIDYPDVSIEDYRVFQHPLELGGWKYLHYAAAKIGSSYDQLPDLYGKYFTPDSRTFDLADFCDIVKKAGGVPILAHPGYIYDDAPHEFDCLIKSMIDCGIQGMECYYPYHSVSMTKHLVSICKRNDLCITGGCDCHGKYDLTEGFTIGGIDIQLEDLNLKGIFS